jgi:hypothetical protein
MGDNVTKKNKNNTVPTEAQPVSELVDQLNPANEIERTIVRLRNVVARPGYAKDRQVGEAMMLFFAAAAWGADSAGLIDRTGLPMDFVVEVTTRMRAAGPRTPACGHTRAWIPGGGGMTPES